MLALTMRADHSAAVSCCCCACAQVVVDTDQTAKALLERGQLTKRVTIIPLNQVRQGSRSSGLSSCRDVKRLHGSHGHGSRLR